MSDSNKAVFLSYAREDADAARRIAEALRHAGVDVWFDESELRGGDEWDLNIRRQIKECALFVPVISANTQTRREGYFRREWNLAAHRLLDMAPGQPFLLPVVIDGTTERDALVADEFRRVQWTRFRSAESLDAFCARVREMLSPSAIGGTRSSESVKTGSPHVPAASAKLGPPTKSRTGTLMGAGAIALVLVALVAFFTRAPAPKGAESSGSASSPAPAAKPPPDLAAAKSVAVLAFDNLSGDKDNEYFSDGISEELLNVLGKVSGLRVAARTSAFYFKGKQTPIGEIAKQLNVGYVVEGSVRKVGTQVRITAQLISAADGFHVWSDTFTRELKDIFALQDEIAGVIAQNLQLKIGTTRPARTVNPEAHRLVLEGRYFWHLRTADGYAQAERAFNQALGLDPEFAPAYAGRGRVTTIRSVYRQLDGYGNGSEFWAAAVADAEKALQLDPENAEAQVSLAYLSYLQKKPEEAERGFRTTLRPEAEADTWSTYGNFQLSVGKLETALAAYERSVTRDPMDNVVACVYAETLEYASRLQEAYEVVDHMAALRTGVYPFLIGERAAVLARLGRRAEAVEAALAFLRQPTLQPRWYLDSEAVLVLVQADRRAEAEQYAADFMRTWPKDSYLRGLMLAALGRFDAALPFLEQTPVIGFKRLYWSVILDPYRSDPRFQQLMVKLGIAAEYRTARETLARMQAEQKTADGGQRTDKKAASK